jgi:3-phosphoshikimate 1-carboxyvinyltransferase
MKALISKSTVSGNIDVPPSKSYTLRALMCAAVSEGNSSIVNPLISDDTTAAKDVLARIGIKTDIKQGMWNVEGGGFHQPDNELYCGESAGTIRFMMTLCSLIQGKSTLTAGPSLMKRPMSTLISALEQIGIRCHSSGGYPPITIEGGTITGRKVELAGNISSQFLSALLFIAPLLKNGMEIQLTTPLESEAYVLMTIDCMKHFGIRVTHSSDQRSFIVQKQNYKPAKYIVEGDWSSMSYLLALGAMAGGIQVNRCRLDSLQGDRQIIDLLKKMGAQIDNNGDSVSVKQSALRGITTDMNECIDLLPTMAVLAAAASGESKFTGIDRARIKESDRVSAIKEGLQSMGVTVQEKQNSLTVKPLSVHGAIIDARNDHRIAMAFSILGAKVGDVTIRQAECVSKTYPEFWQVFEKVGGKVTYEQ